MSTPRTKLLALAALFVLLAAPAASANPFLSDASGKSAAVAAAPASATPRTLVELQLAFRDSIAKALNVLQKGYDAAALGLLLGGAFLYGVLHAAGPGHRKAVVFSLFIARRAKAWEPLAAGFLSAAVHAAAGIAVVAALGLLRGAVATLASTANATAYMEGGTFVLLLAIALGLVLTKAVSLATGSYKRHEHAGGGRAKGIYSIVALTSLVPCPGAVVVLLFALYLNLNLLGIAAVLAMSVGMGLVVSAAGYLAYFGREGLFLRLKKREGAVAFFSTVLELLSYSVLALFSAYMAWPFVAALIA